MLRGVAVMRRVACMKLPDPPSLNIQVVPPVPDPAKSTRDRYRHPRHRRRVRHLPRHHRPDRLRVRDVRRHGGAARGRDGGGHVQGRAPGRERRADQRQHHQQHDDRYLDELPQRLRGHVRRQQRAGDGAGQQRAGARVRRPAVLPVVVGPQRRLASRTRSSRSSTCGSRCRPTSRASSSRCWSPTSAARCSTNGAPSEEAAAQPAVRSCKAVGAGATALPFYRLLENSVAQAAGEPVPLRFCGIYHPHGIAAEYFAMLNGRFSGLGSDTETTFNLTYTEQRHAVRAAAVRRRRHVRPELQEQDPADRGHRPDVERQRARHGRHDPDRQLHRGRQAENSSLDQYMAVERKLGAATRVTSIAVGVGDDSTAGRDDAVVRSRRRAAAQGHRSGAGVQHAVLRLRPDQRSGGGGGGDARTAPRAAA